MNQAPIQILQMTPNSLIVYNEYQFRSTRSASEIQNEKNLTRGEFNGNISIKAKRVITKRLNSWLGCLIENNKKRQKTNNERKRKPTFITLTLPSKQIHCDNEIKRKCLTPYISRLQKKFNVKHWFWVAESQKNGNIHFHLIIDTFIHHKTVRELWQRDLERLGYVSEFKKKHGHSNPNCTDIHVVGGFELAIKYVVKYVQKSKSCRPIKGRLHGISDKLKEIKQFTTLIDDETSEFLHDAINQKKSRYFLGSHFTVIYCDVFNLESFKSSDIKKDFRKYLANVYDFLYKDSELKVFQIDQVKEEPEVLQESPVITKELQLF